MTSKKPFTINDNQSQNTIHSIVISVPENVQMKTLPNNGVVNKPNENMRNRGSVATSMLGTSAMVQESVAPKSTVYSMDTSNSNMFKATKKASNPWHGVRVRIGVHYGMGDIRKDPVSLGFDYYGTVVNTAARVEGVGHGGQTLLTDSVFEQLPPGFTEKTKTIIVSLGPQPLRGLDAPIHLYQAVPIKLQARRFPALRLHVEKDTEESSMTETATTATGTTTMTETPEGLAGRLCASKQFAGVAPEEIMDRYNYFLATFGPIKDKYQATVITKLAESWGFEKAAKVVNAGGVGRTRLLVSLIAKVTKAYHSNKGATSYGKTRYGTTVTHTSMSNGNHYQETVSMSEAIKSIHQTQDANSLSGTAR
eukprot:GDKK01032749.1.p1 GENE.GDKK01032749.1~~GDKK01032749.1.p1  ORF type:complete len:422 (+),score=49.03 GDKK01032749.1:171-1268(+)